MLFRKEINPFSVTDKVTFRNAEKTLTLKVLSDASTLVLNLKKAQDKLLTVTDGSTDAEKEEVARLFAKSIFGSEQANRLYEFYGEPLVVINVCGMYFKGRLADKITKAQKK